MSVKERLLHDVTARDFLVVQITPSIVEYDDIQSIWALYRLNFKPGIIRYELDSKAVLIEALACHLTTKFVVRNEFGNIVAFAIGTDDKATLEKYAPGYDVPAMLERLRGAPFFFVLALCFRVQRGYFFSREAVLIIGRILQHFIQEQDARVIYDRKVGNDESERKYGIPLNEEISRLMKIITARSAVFETQSVQFEVDYVGAGAMGGA